MKMLQLDLINHFLKKNPVEGEYYVLPSGQFTRYVNGEKLKPTDSGFLMRRLNALYR